ncbi:MAG: dienelactone hydrolase family protein [Bacteroidetes bacterium]|nr:dienelactone hydrolase family protein [Bacteroidota bacterium]
MNLIHLLKKTISLSLVIFIIIGSKHSVFAQEPNVEAAVIWEKIETFFSPPAEFADKYGEFLSPLKFYNGRSVETIEDWQKRREEILSRWNNMMGVWPPLIKDQEVEILETTHRENFMQYRIRFYWTPTEKTEGYLLIPDGEGKKPAVITVYYEPETAIGLGKPYRDFAYQLTKRGFVTLSIGTTRATKAKTYALYYPSLTDAKVEPLSMLACAAVNAWYVLANRPEVDSDHIGIVGHSFGGKWAMFASEDPPQRWVALNHTIAVNRLLGVNNRVAMTNRPEHSPNLKSNEQIYLFFEFFLKH